MEIKVDDKVRVREDAPRMYVAGLDYIFVEVESEVVEVEDGNATIEVSERSLTIPTKYLIKIEDEAKEPKLKKGDRVRYVGDIPPTYKGKTFVIDGNAFFNDYFNEWQASSIKPYMWDGLSVCNVPLSDLEPYTEPTEEEITRQKEAELDEFRKEELDKVLHPEKYTTYKVTVDNVAMDWDAYTADLAREIVLKVANKYNDPEEAADYAVKVAKEVVEGLKKK